MADNYSKEELRIVNGIESGEYTSVKNLNDDKSRYSDYAGNTFRKDKKVRQSISKRSSSLFQSNCFSAASTA